MRLSHRVISLVLGLAAFTGGFSEPPLYSQPQQGITPKVDPKPVVPVDPPKLVDPKVEKVVLPPNALGRVGQITEIKAETAGEIDWEIPGQIQARLFPAEKLAILVPQSGGTFVIRLLVCENGKPKIHRCTLLVEGAPAPTPDPDPGPDPKPPVPVPSGGLRVIFVRETSANHSKEQLNILNSLQIATYLNAKAAKGSDGRPGWRQWDPQQDLTHADPIMKALWEATKPQLPPLPAVVIAVDTKGTVFPLPATEKETLELLKKFGG